MNRRDLLKRLGIISLFSFAVKKPNKSFNENSQEEKAKGFNVKPSAMSVGRKERFEDGKK
ncbi:hypothetical protein D9V87_04930 [Bacteroidetes/Chlorobi group bacterium MS-B_bin-24]|jgi:hypothetical protein|nr:MAG: hypothetical protein D9V87_04930 [Bacteroidetes/Chlorobi group bacterium MS-B_bin-24]